MVSTTSSIAVTVSGEMTETVRSYVCGATKGRAATASARISST
jgi:hypothetical protein